MRSIYFLLFFIAGSILASGQGYEQLNSKVLQLYKEGKYSDAILVAINAKAAAQKEFGETSRNYAQSLNNLAVLYKSIGNYAAAESLYKQGIAIDERLFGDKHPTYAHGLNNLAGLYFSIGNYLVAEPLYKQALAIRKKSLGEEHPDYATSLNDLAALYYSTGNYVAAEPLYKQALSIRKKVYGEENTNYAHSLNNLALLYNSMGNTAAAEPMYKKALFIRKKLLGEKHPDYAGSLNNLAAFYVGVANYEAAELLFKQAMTIWKDIWGEEHPNYAESLNNLAELYSSKGNYSAAEPLYKKALLIKKRVLGEEHPNYAVSLNNLALLYIRTGSYAVAEPLIKQAAAINKKLLGENHPAYATSLNNLALLYNDIGNFVSAELLYKQASAIYKKAFGEQHSSYASSVNNLAAFYLSIGNFDAAIPLYKQALTIRRQILGEEHPVYAESLNSLGGLYVNSGDYEGAELVLKQALAITKKAFGENHPTCASSLRNLSVVYKALGNYAAAEALIKQALVITKKVKGEEHPDYASGLDNLAVLYARMGKYPAAKTLVQQALAIKKKTLGQEHPDYANSLNDLATLNENMGNYTEAAKLFIAATSITFNHIEKNFDNLSEAEKLKWWRMEMGNFEVAPSLLFTNPHNSNNFLQQACTQQLQLKEFILNKGTRVLQQARREGSYQGQQLLSQWQINRATLAKQYSLPITKRMPGLTSLEEKVNEQEKQINLQFADFRTSRKNQRIGFAEVRQQLKPDEAAVEFMRFNYYRKGWTDSILYAAFIILSNDTVPHFVTLFEEKQLARLLASKVNSSEAYVKDLYRGVIPLNINQGNAKKGDSLYQLVLKPLLPWLKGIKKINIAPAGLLNRVAFNALPVDSSTYFIDMYQLRQYSSVRQIAEHKIPPRNNSKINDAVLYGGINFTLAEYTFAPNYENGSNKLPVGVKRTIRGGAWSSLPGTLQEVNGISQLLKSNNQPTRVITGSASTEESLKQLSGRSPTILHLATHGFMLPDVVQKREGNLNNTDNQFTLADDPLLRSGIIMAGANSVWTGAEPIVGKEDGIVTAYEISNLDLNNTDLAVLSACETALGDVRGTEGVFGLQRAFKLAGANNMLLSLWQVPDKETAELMILLYTNKLKGMGNYEAFHKAQDTMRKKYSPYYWAAFVLIE